jgi:hypothetical protein
MLRETAIGTFFRIDRDLFHAIPAKFHARSGFYWQGLSPPVSEQDHYDSRHKER